MLGGDELQFSDLFQGKPVVLNFWAGLCAPCLAEMPGFQRVYDLHKEQFLLLGLDIGPSIDLGSVEEGKSLLQELGIAYPTGTSSKADVPVQYEVQFMPTTVFLTPDGDIFRKWGGPMSEQKMTEVLSALISAS